MRKGQFSNMREHFALALSALCANAVAAGAWPELATHVQNGHKIAFCPDDLQETYLDMHDGDKKDIVIAGKSMTIKPSGSKQAWVVKTGIDPASCSATVDFNVPGKPSPPPVNLSSTLWYSISAYAKKTEFEFTDPSGKLAPKTFPLNRWIGATKITHHKPLKLCPESFKVVFADMHDGDKKEVTISGTSMTVKPSGNNQTWLVKAQLDPESCSATIDFNVAGKPSPPPVPLAATLWYTVSATSKKRELEFTDPSGTLAPRDTPLNAWVEITDQNAHDLQI